jgi:hypothetical protein
MSTVVKQRRPVWTWPIIGLWRLVTFVANLTGILLALFLGLVLMVVGSVFCATIFGAVVGIPLFVVGFLLVIRALY